MYACISIVAILVICVKNFKKYGFMLHSRQFNNFDEIASKLNLKNTLNFNVTVLIS